MRRLVPLLILALSVCFTPAASGRLQHFNVTVTVIGPGYVGGCNGDGDCIKCPSLCSGLFRQGTTIRLDPQPYTGATFGGWGGECAGSGTGSCTIQIYAAKNVSASFGQAPPPPPPAFPLTVVKHGSGSGFVGGGGGIDCGPTCTASVGSGATLKLIAVADPSSRFTGWGGACAGTQPCDLTMTAAMSVDATFELLRAPNVTALPSAGVRGKIAKLRYRVTTDGGDAHREVVTVLQGRRMLARLANPVAAGSSFFVSWRVPKTLQPRALKFCVRATDTATKKIAVSCAPLRIT
jgi:Divergent InlB B-repeat domain